jgi:ABC-type Mn2+/Zn2+ transport system ATPase subunit
MSSHRLLIRDVTVSYDRTPALEGIDLELTCGTCAGLIGPNGAGKSTLLKAIAGLIRPQSGTISLHGEKPGHSRGVAYLPQRGLIDWDFPITVRGMVSLGRFPSLGAWRTFNGKDSAIVDEALAATQLTPLADRQINALSGGQQQRAFLARAHAQQAHVCLLDEPFAGLDATSQRGLHGILRAMASEGRLVFVSHHDLSSVPELFDEVVLLNRTLIAHGPTADTFTETKIARTYECAPQPHSTLNSQLRTHP